MASARVRIDKDDLVLSIFEQNWLHARHVENQRVQMFGFYVLLVVAFFALAGQVVLEGLKTGRNYDIPPLLLLVMIMISLVFLLFSLRLECEFHQHVVLIEKLVEAYNLEEYMGKPLDLWEGLNLPNWLSMPLFSMFYLTMATFFVCEWITIYSFQVVAYIIFVPLIIFSYFFVKRSQENVYKKIKAKMQLRR